ncbi:MAG: sugar transferase [Candidatus Pacebacteria bacterium]|nr:sugar transferase [Candidatus Paceibacterota bacterium]
MFFIFIADIAISIVALFLMLLFRYGTENVATQWSTHFIPFIFASLIFTITFYIFNLYSFRFNKNITEFIGSFIKSIIIGLCFSILIFYIFGDFFKLTPKTNLLIFTSIFGIIDFYFRIKIKRYFDRQGFNRKIILIAEEENNLIQEIKDNKNAGYTTIDTLKVLDIDKIFSQNPDLIVTDAVKENKQIFTLMKKGVFVYTIKNFYEEVFQKIPIKDISKEEALHYVLQNKTVFNFFKRSLDIVLSVTLFVIFIPIFILLAIAIKVTSKGPVFFKHKRISLNDEEFIIYKFRSMYIDAEKNGAVWTKDNKTDVRITPVGRFIRETHLDEIPQLINIIKGDLSFVGPRPERPEFTPQLSKDIQYYDLRHSVKAGLTGWAQVNYKYGASTEDALEKLKYDFYYIKNRNIFFDILIILKTIAKIFNY